MVETQMIMPKPPKEVRWMAPEFHYHEKDDSWSKGIILIAVLLIGFALWQRNFLFAVFIAIATALLVYWGHQKPDTVEFLLDDKGFTVHGKRRDYKNLDGFAVRIDERGELEWNKLILRVKSKLIPHLIIFIPKNETGKIRVFLNEYIPEIEHEDSFIDLLADLIKF